MSKNYPVARAATAQEALIAALEIHIDKGAIEPSASVVIREDIRRARSAMDDLQTWAASFDR